MYSISTAYVDTQLFDSETFASALKTNKSPYKVFKHTLVAGNLVLKDRSQSMSSATQSVYQRAWLMDQVILEAWKRYTWANSENIALVAVGGYGRNELHPASDVDLMVLLRQIPDDETKQCIEDFLMFLWDIRLEVGHSVRTIEECEKEGGKDITIATNLMESRLLIGPDDLYQAMQKAVSPSNIWSSKEFFTAKSEEQARRHQKYDDSAYNLEPNIKEGPGGLRDIQTIGWVAKRHFGATTLYDLVKHNFLTEQEFTLLHQAQEFLWQIRCLLHTGAGRREDRLLFDYQRSLATVFGYEDDGVRLGVEKFMKQYYRTVRTVRSLNEMLLQLFEEMIIYGNVTVRTHKINNRFQVRNDFLEVTHNQVFMRYPFALLEVFLIMQQNPSIKGIRARTIRLIQQSMHLIDKAFRKDLKNRSLFLEIFRHPQGLTHALRRMNSYGVLGAYIPQFGKIVGQMQYDLFHVYTVDQHTLFVIRNLRRLTTHPDELALCSDVKKQLPKLEIIYLAGLFHDIAKGRGGDHSVLGEKDALNFCLNHDLSDYDSRLVAWLVRHHLVMSTTAQRKDISDPDVIRAFAQLVQDTEKLNYLYLLTVSDIRATSPTLWNSWKDSLLANLYRRTHDALRFGAKEGVDRRSRIEKIQGKAYSVLLLNGENNDEDSITHLWEDLGEDYFLYSTPEDVAKETQAILSYDNWDVPLILERYDQQGSTEFLIYSPDSSYLFAHTIYCLEQQDLNIVDAYVIPTWGEYTISAYKVLESNGRKISSKERVEQILHELRQNLSQEATSFCPINRRLSRQLKHFPIPTVINFTQDYINNHTVIAVTTTDRPGVLSSIAQALMTCQVRIKRAKIATFGSKVEDFFFITDSHGQALFSTEQMEELRKELFNLLDSDKQ